jgi:hypothetical protein
MNLLSTVTVSVMAIVLLLGAASVHAQGRGNSGGRGNGGERGNAPALAPGLERQQVHQVPEPGTLTLLSLVLGGGLVARGLQTRRRRA